MSDIDFQNGFIVGMATKGLTRNLYRSAAPNATVISSTNMYFGSLSMTHIVLEFSEAVGSYTYNLNKEAFWIFGYKDFILTDFDLRDIIKINDTRFAFKVKDFSKSDGQIVFAYTASKGALQGVSGPVEDFLYKAPILFSTPRIKIMNKYTGISFNAGSNTYFAIKPVTENTKSCTLIPLNSNTLYDNFGGIDISNLALSASFSLSVSVNDTQADAELYTI